MKTKTIELSDYIVPDLYFWAKEHNTAHGESLPIRIVTDIADLAYWGDDKPCFDFCIEFVKMPFIARAKSPLYVNMYDGSVAKQVTNAKGSSWMRLFYDVDGSDKDCARWLKSDHSNDYYFADDSAWVKATFNEGLLDESI